jgi:hypothetical protein
MKLNFFFIAVIATIMSPLANANEPIKHIGMCDASAAIPVNADSFVVANDEDNILRVYKRDESAKEIQQYDMTEFLQVDTAKSPEADIEGATLIGHRIYWISSHGANKEGKFRPNRRRLFATDMDNNGVLKPVGKPFNTLIEALKAAPELKGYHLGKAADKAAEAQDGLNIEGLTRTPEGDLLIGFRNPIPNGKALIVPIKNPKKVVEQGKTPKFDKVVELDLGGLGIRSIEYVESKRSYFIVAGSFDNAGVFKLYQWSGNVKDQPKPIDSVNFGSMRPEALIVYATEPNRLQFLSDDGDEPINGKPCKELSSTPQAQYFRSIWIELP